jgi:hypothetical protein
MKKTNITIKKGFYYRLKFNSQTFERKYGDGNPMILIEDLDSVIFNGKRWFDLVNTNPACMVFLARQLLELGLDVNESIDVSKSRKVYYGKIKQKDSPFSLGELVYADELENV